MLSSPPPFQNKVTFHCIINFAISTLRYIILCVLTETYKFQRRKYYRWHGVNVRTNRDVSYMLYIFLRKSTFTDFKRANKNVYSLEWWHAFQKRIHDEPARCSVMMSKLFLLTDPLELYILHPKCPMSPILFLKI